MTATTETVTIVAATKQEAERAARAQVAARHTWAHSAVIIENTRHKSYEITIEVTPEPPKDRVGKTVAIGSPVVFGYIHSNGNVRRDTQDIAFGIVESIKGEHVNVRNGETGGIATRLAKQVLSIPTSLKVEDYVATVDRQRVVAG